MSSTNVEQKSFTALVVDDEDDLREIMCFSLQRRGFTTLAAGGPRDAVTLCQDHDGPVDVLVTDLGLPGVSGAQLAGLLKGMRPRLRVLYVSGWSRDSAIDRGLIDERGVVLEKPFTSDQLVQAVRSVLSDLDAGVAGSPRR